jgi:hypothetical protein
MRDNGMRGGAMRARLLLAALAATVIAAPAAWAQLAEVGVVTGPRNENNSAADWNGTEEVLAWSRSRPGHPSAYDAWVRVGGNPVIKLNVGGRGWMGGIDYPLVAYQRLLNGQSNIYLYDLSSDSRPATPAGVNTNRWEWHPTISGEWLLFGRSDRRRDRIVLHNTTTGEERVLETANPRHVTVRPDQVNGNWATYTRCQRTCNVIRYDITAEAKTTLPRPAGASSRHQYGSSVTSAGTVYFARSGNGCGRNIRIIRAFGPGDPPTGTAIAHLARGRDLYPFSYARENTDGSADVFYDRYSCAKDRDDIYKVTDPAPGP